MNNFKTALQLGLLFPAPNGNITTQDLFSLPLTATSNRPSLDGVAIALSRKIKESENESFVVKKTNTASTLELQLEIVKEIIADAVEEKNLKTQAASKRVEKAQLLEILARKQSATLEGLSENQIKARINAL